MSPSVEFSSQEGSGSLCLTRVKAYEQQFSAVFSFSFALLWHGTKLMGLKTCFVFFLYQAVNIEAEHDCSWLRYLIFILFLHSWRWSLWTTRSNFMLNHMQIYFTFLSKCLQCYLTLKSIAQTCLTPCPACKQRALSVSLSTVVCFQSQLQDQSWWSWSAGGGCRVPSAWPWLSLSFQGALQDFCGTLHLCKMWFDDLN